MQGTNVCGLEDDPATQTLPVIMVTAKTSEIDVVKGLDHGADDYLCKPFGIMEFISRVKAVLRRSAAAAPAPAPKTLQFGFTAAFLAYPPQQTKKMLVFSRGTSYVADVANGPDRR